jgi:hypothetical protein
MAARNLPEDVAAHLQAEIERSSSADQQHSLYRAQGRGVRARTSMITVLDASALIAFLRDEPGAEAVQNLLACGELDATSGALRDLRSNLVGTAQG